MEGRNERKKKEREEKKEGRIKGRREKGEGKGGEKGVDGRRGRDDTKLEGRSRGGGGRREIEGNEGWVRSKHIICKYDCFIYIFKRNNHNRKGQMLSVLCLHASLFTSERK